MTTKLRKLSFITFKLPQLSQYLSDNAFFDPSSPVLVSHMVFVRVYILAYVRPDNKTTYIGSGGSRQIAYSTLIPSKNMISISVYLVRLIDHKTCFCCWMD